MYSLIEKGTFLAVCSFSNLCVVSGIYETLLIVKFRFVFWDVLSCKIIVDRRFRGTCCLHHQDDEWWRQHVPLERQSTVILHGSTSQKTDLNFILTTVRTWNLTLLILPDVIVSNRSKIALFLLYPFVDRFAHQEPYFELQASWILSPVISLLRKLLK
jgi:hypothetical protein